jgi:hypothetical protein
VGSNSRDAQSLALAAKAARVARAVYITFSRTDIADHIAPRRLIYSYILPQLRRFFDPFAQVWVKFTKNSSKRLSLGVFL